MANKFHGLIGFEIMNETKPGVYLPEIVTRTYNGDVIRNQRSFQSTEQSTNDNLNINNQISIVADGYAANNFHSMRYIEWMGAKWKISNIEVQRPRLILTIGGLYNDKRGPSTQIP